MSDKNSPERQTSNIEPPWLRGRSEISQVHVSARSFEVIKKVLAYPESELKKGKVLSIGEGLSDYACKLHQQMGVDAIAIDPIYELGLEIFTTDKDKIKKLLTEKYGKRVIFNPLRDEIGFPSAEQTKVQPPNQGKIMAASVYELPFKSEAFTHIVLYRTIQHLEPKDALPEMIRVIKPDGEIRMGGLPIEASIFRGELYPGQFKLKRGMEGNEFRPYGSFLKPMMEYLAKNPELRAYIIVDVLNSQGDKIWQDLVSPRSLVIRKDGNLPKTADLRTEVWKINPTPVVSNYEVEITMQFYTIGYGRITYYLVSPSKIGIS